MAFRKLAMEILELVIAGLGVDAHHFEAHKRKAQGTLRANYYRHHNSKDQVHIGLSPHVDGNLLTILHQQDVSGLEVLKDGRWFHVAPQTDAFCINVADILQVYCYAIKGEKNQLPNSVICTNNLIYYITFLSGLFNRFQIPMQMKQF